MLSRWIDGTRARLRLLLGRRAAEARIDEELRFRIEMETDRRVRDHGLDPNEARRLTLAAFGGVEQHREQLREGRGLAWLAGMSLDLKLGVRMLAKSPGLTIVGVLGMAVAVAVGAVSFGVIYNFVGTTVPLDDGDRIVVIENVDVRRSIEIPGTHLHDLATWRDALQTVEELGAYRMVNRNLITRDGRPEGVLIAEMTGSGFRVARVPPMLGRYFNEEDERKGAPPVVVVGYDLWQSRFGARPDIVGRTIQLGATVHTVIGVMPDGFAFPINNRLWTPLRLDPSDYTRGEAPAIQVFGRLAPNASLGAARTQLTTVGRRLAAAHPETHERLQPRVLPYTLSFVDNPELTWALYIVQLLISMLLVVIGTNVATLVYARTASRMGEIAIRTALGASRARVVAQLFAEALVLSTAAAAVGLGAAWVTLRQIEGYVARMGRDPLPFWMDFGLSPGMILYVAGLAVFGAVIIGVLPALKATRRQVNVTLQQLAPGGTGLRLGKTWTVLIVAQVAVTVAVLPAVLYAAFVQRGEQGVVGPEIPTGEWLTASLHLDRESAPSGAAGASDGAFTARYAGLEAELVRRVKADSRVADVVVSSSAPGAEPKIRIDVASTTGTTASDTAGTASTGRTVGMLRVDLEFFRAFGLPVLAGRAFTAGDVIAEPNVVIVNRSFVRQILGGADPLGRRVRATASRSGSDPESEPAGPWLEIVGVVPDFPTATDPTDLRPKLYRPLVPGITQPVSLAVRVRAAAPAAFATRFRELAVAVDPMLRLGDVRALDEMLSIERIADRVIVAATGLVMVSVILLSAAGIYALMSFTVARRRREIGIRAALGAGSRHVVGGVLATAARQIAIGILIGILLAGVNVQAMEGGLGDRRGAVLLAAVAAFMTIVGLLAALGPARRALRIHPTEALRSD